MRDWSKKWEIETRETESRSERQMQKMRDRHEKQKTWSLRQFDLIFAVLFFALFYFSNLDLIAN
jgi:hypothetical protein